MKEKITNVVDGFFIFLLVICSFQCLTSSFEIKINLAIVAMCVAMFTLVFALLAILEKSTVKYAVSLAVIFIVFVLMVMFSNKVLLSQLNYAVNCVLEIYSRYLPVAKTAGLASLSADSATALFVALSLPVSGLLTTFIMRCRIVFPAVIISAVIIVPCFILVNTLPDLLPLLTTLVILFTLYVSSSVHRTNASHSGVVSSAVAVLMAVLVMVVYVFNPIEGYERHWWQDELLNLTEQIGFKNYDGKSSIVSSSVKNIKTEVDLSNAGPKEKQNRRVMKIISPYTGKIYLKGIAYANYEDNTWSILTDEQAEDCPVEFQSATMTASDELTKSTINITTINKDSVIYTPYYLSSVPKFGTEVCDILITNDTNAEEYDVSFQPFEIDNYSAMGKALSESEFGAYSFAYVKSEAYAEYKSFVYQTYLSVPEDIKAEMIKCAENEGFAYLSKEEIIDSVEEYVRNSATYSLKTERVPDGKDISLWFLNESDTGYCVHFATSTAIMLRSLGIPARYVTGYCVNSNAEMTFVTSDNAHAWVEYFDDNIGWVPLESTPEDFSILSQATQSDTQTAAETDTQPTTPTESATATQSTVTTQSETNKPTNNAQSANDNSGDGTSVKVSARILTTIKVVIVGISSVLFVILILLLRRVIILSLRKRHFLSGKRNERVRYIYRYILRISKFSYVPIPEDIRNIAEKARFGNTKISNKELDLILHFAENRKEQLMSEASKIKKIYFKYILAFD